MIVGPDLAGRGLDRERVGVGPAVAAQVQDRLAGAVAGQLGLGPVGVEDPQARRRSRARRWRRAAARRRSRCRCAARTARRTRAGVSSKGSVLVLDDHVVVAQRLPLLERHAGRVSSNSSATSSGVAAGDVDERRRRAACASRSAGAGRSGACGASSPRRRRRAARRSRGPCGRCRRRPAASAASTSSAAPAATMASTRASIAAVQRLAVHDQAERGGSGGGCARSRAAGPLGRLLAGVEQLERADEALAVVGVDGRCRLGVAARRAARGRRRGPSASTAARQRSRAAGVGRRAQVELGQRGAQVQAGAADDDRAAARRRSSASISAWASGGVARRREKRSVEGHEADEPVLEPRAARPRSGAPVRISRPA